MNERLSEVFWGMALVCPVPGKLSTYEEASITSKNKGLRYAQISSA